MGCDYLRVPEADGASMMLNTLVLSVFEETSSFFSQNFASFCRRILENAAPLSNLAF